MSANVDDYTLDNAMEEQTLMIFNELRDELTASVKSSLNRSQLRLLDRQPRLVKRTRRGTRSSPKATPRLSDSSSSSSSSDLLWFDHLWSARAIAAATLTQNNLLVAAVAVS